jgi:LmbE family N-acetylglucosaminyl deacetylase
VSDPLRVLVVSAHPDDIEFGCAGSVAVWVNEGAEVTYVIVTDGSTGTTDTTIVGGRLAEIRREESIKAAKIVGVDDVRFLGYRDGYVEYTLDLRRDVAREFRRARPDRFVVMDPQILPGGWFVNHPDHRAVGQASLDITITAGTTPGHFPELLEEGLEPWRGLKEIYITGPGGGETAVDVTSVIDKKVEALKAHHSQVGDWDGLDDMIRGWMKVNGTEHGMEYAELFHLIRPLGAEAD